jgi:hypothetical protein
MSANSKRLLYAKTGAIHSEIDVTDRVARHIHDNTPLLNVWLGGYDSLRGIPKTLRITFTDQSYVDIPEGELYRPSLDILPPEMYDPSAKPKIEHILWGRETKGWTDATSTVLKCLESQTLEYKAKISKDILPVVMPLDNRENQQMRVTYNNGNVVNYNADSVFDVSNERKEKHTIVILYYIWANNNPFLTFWVSRQIQLLHRNRQHIDSVQCIIRLSDQTACDIIRRQLASLGSLLTMVKIDTEGTLSQAKALELFLAVGIDSNTAYLYLHTHGAHHGDGPVALPMQSTRKCMDYFLIERLIDCVERLNSGQCDAVGLFHMHDDTTNSDQYHGNCWWVTGAYLKILITTFGMPSLLAKASIGTWIFKCYPRYADLCPLNNINLITTCIQGYQYEHFYSM